MDNLNLFLTILILIGVIINIVAWSDSYRHHRTSHPEQK
jgi:hypothetical protein